MAFTLKTGFLHRKELPAIGDSERLGGLVDLQWWIQFTKSSPRLSEGLHIDDRPTAIFTLEDGSKLEVRYQFGFIIPQDFEGRNESAMQELLAHMNEQKKAPIQPSQHQERPIQSDSQHGVTDL